MHIAELTLKNWMVYEGEHVLALEAKPYAIIARRDGDSDSSNMAGKTALMEAIGFVLFGVHRFRTEDEWITRSAADGAVRLVTDDGWSFLRSRERGKATRFVVQRANDAGVWSGKEADEKARQLLGFSESDWYATCAMAQRQMAQFVLAKPEERMRMVEGWFDLGKLEEAASLAEEAVRESARKVEELSRVLQPVRPTLDVEGLAQVAKELSERAKAMEKSRSILAEAERIEMELAELENHREDAVVVKTALPGDREEVPIILGRLGEKGAKLRVIESVARGQFDGQCPVVGIACPARAEVEGQKHHANNQAAEIKQSVVDDRLRLDELQKRIALEDETRRQAERAKQEEAHLEQMRTNLEARYDALPEPEFPGVTPGDLKLAEEAARTAGELAVRAKVEAEAFQRGDEAYRRAQAALSEATQARALAAAAAAVLGRQGAQRRLAERALGVIEADANSMLADGGIPLSVAMRWGREGQGPAKACGECGAAFPTSTKVKACLSCGALRGTHVVPKLEVDLSDRSGAAEDMAGVAMQLAAGAWLRRRRGAAWATALIDEPFGACDVSNRRALGRQLASLLCGRHGFAQAFVVAHSSETLDAMPGRIEVLWSGGRSTVRVIA